MDAVEFLKALKRRSKSNPDYYGEDLNIAYINPISLVPQVESWAKENPVKTRQNEFLKMFPHAFVEDDGALTILPCSVDKTVKGSCVKKTCNACRHDYWSQEVE